MQLRKELKGYVQEVKESLDMTAEGRILVVDDQHGPRITLRAILKSHSWEVIEAVSGEEALAIIEDEGTLIDVVLLDIMMPGISGFEVLDSIKGNPETEQIKVIMFTALANVEDKVRAFLFGASDYIVKPCESEELLAKVGIQINLKHTEKSLRDSEERFRQMSELNPFPLCVCTRDGRIDYINPQFDQLFGYRIEDIPTIEAWFERAFPDIEYREQVKATWESDQIVINRQETVKRTFDITCIDGSVKMGTIRFLRMKDGKLYMLFHDVTEDKRMEAELRRVQGELVETARKVGMAEVATGILHNVGNVVNSVGITAASLKEKIQNLRMSNLARVADMLEEHQDDLGTFITTDEKGKKIPSYISSLAKHMTDEQDVIKGEVENLSVHVRHIIEIINIQQSYSKTVGVTEPVNPVELMEDALQINAGGLTRNNVGVVREFDNLATVLLDRHQVLQILTNLINNARWALSQNGQSSRLLMLKIAKTDDDQVQFTVADNGIGIPRHNMTRIFSYGFTTKQDGHGFGLHGGAIVAKEMGGSLQAYSDGPGKGAEFILELPINREGGQK